MSGSRNVVLPKKKKKVTEDQNEERYQKESKNINNIATKNSLILALPFGMALPKHLT